MSAQGIKLVFGGGAIGNSFVDKTDIDAVLDLLASGGVTTIDTAQLYGESETLLGNSNAGERFILDTKEPSGFRPSPLEGLVDRGLESLKKLKVKQVDIFYLHTPNHTEPLAKVLSLINTLHQHGAFKRFGLSNFKAEEVRAAHAHCKQNGYILPSVYQGNYGPVARLQETLLFPTLRDLGMAFYAYSPLAGGFLTKTKEQVLAGAGRFDTGNSFGQLYAGMYAKPAYLDALAEWDAVATKAGCEKAELAYRWVTFNCALKAEYGDAIIFGARTLGQAEETLKWLGKGPLGVEACRGVDEVWKKIEHEAPLDNFNR